MKNNSARRISKEIKFLQKEKSLKILAKWE
jgi:hypothetical protein